MASSDDIKTDDEIKNQKDNDKKTEPFNQAIDEPIDGGWGWIVAIGSATVMGMNMATILAFGIIYSKFLSTMDASPVTVAWIFNFEGFIRNLTGLFAPPLCDIFGLRRVAISSSILFSLSVFTSSFASSSWHLFMSYTLLGGITRGLNLAMALFIIPKYFKKRRGAAMAIMMSGTSAGVFGWSIIVTYLQEKYAYSGGTLILSAICLHSLPATLVFHPVSCHSRSKSRNLMMNNDIASATLRGTSNTSGENKKHSSVKPETINKLAAIFFKSFIKNFKMIKSYRALTVSMVISLSVTGYMNINMMIPFWLQKIGFSIEESAFCVSIGAITNWIARIIILLFSDTKIFNVRIAYPVSVIYISSIGFIMTFLSNWKAIFVSVCCFGVGMGLIISLFTLLMINVMGMKDYQPTYGLFGLFNAIEYITIGPIAGLISDKLSYQSSMLFADCVLFLSFICYSFLPLAIRKDKALQTEYTES